MSTISVVVKQNQRKKLAPVVSVASKLQPCWLSRQRPISLASPQRTGDRESLAAPLLVTAFMQL